MKVVILQSSLSISLKLAKCVGKELQLPVHSKGRRHDISGNEQSLSLISRVAIANCQSGDKENGNWLAVKSFLDGKSKMHMQEREREGENSLKSRW